MSTYYKIGPQVVYRIAASRITYEDANGVIQDLPLTGGGGGAADWNTLANKPASIGAGATNAAARTAIFAAAQGVNGDITSITGLTVPLTAAQGGTGFSSIAATKTAMGIGHVGTATMVSINNLDTVTASGEFLIAVGCVGVPDSRAIGGVAEVYVDSVSNTAVQFIKGGNNTYCWIRTWNGSGWRAWRQFMVIGPELLALTPATAGGADIVAKHNELLDILQG